MQAALVVFIDDLDRAAPPKPVEAIEAINLLLDSEHCAFVLGMDSQSVAKSIEAKHKDLKEDGGDEERIEIALGQRFLNKIIEISFVMPRAGETAFTAFINSNLGFKERRGGLSEEEVDTAGRMIVAKQ